jgi:hypothetical protein
MTTESTIENFMKGVDGRNVTQMASLMQNYVESQLFGDGVTATQGDIHLDADIAEAFKTIKDLLLGDIQKALNNEHSNDQHAVNQLHKCWDQCKSAHDSDQEQVDEMWTIMQQTKTAHETCREDVHAKYVDKVIKCNALDVWIDGLKCPDCYKEECVTIHDPNNRKVGDMLQAHIAWATSSYAEWSVKHAACAQAVRDHEAADTACDKTQGSFESGACAHRQALWTSCNVNQMACCQRCSVEFNAEVNRVECAEKDRKIDWSATKKIECYLDVLMASPTDEQLKAKCKQDGTACINQWREAKYKSCDAVCQDIDYEAGDYYLVDGVNTTHRSDSSHGKRCTLHLDINFPRMPTCVNCPPPVPGPCEEFWINTYYTEYDSTSSVAVLEDENECHPDQHQKWWAYSRAECRPCASLIGRTCGVAPGVKDSCFYGNQVRIFATAETRGWMNLGEVIVNGGAKMQVSLSDSWAAPHLKDNCVDGDPNTFCHSAHPKGWWVAFTLEEPTCIETITVLNRHNGWHDRIIGSGISVINQGTEIWTDTFDTAAFRYEWNLADAGLSHAGTYDVYYRGGKRSVGAVMGCDGGIEQPGIFKDQLRTEGVREKCSQARDAKAIYYVMNTHGAGKYECLWPEGNNLVGSHYTGPNAFWGTIEYRSTSQSSCPKPGDAPKVSTAGNYDVYYRGGKRSVGAVMSCDGGIEQPGIFKDQLRTEGVREKCSQARDAQATYYVLNTHGAGKYECLWVEGDNVVGSHYTGPNAFWGTIEYRLTSRTSCPPQASREDEDVPQLIEGPISARIISEHDTYDHRFPAKNVLDSTWQGGSHNNGQTYLTRNCGGGWFVMQMQEIGTIKEFQILNTCNTPYNDRSTKDISISLSKDNTNWENVINYQMQRCTPIKGDPLVLPSPNPINAQYIKVELKTCYGASAGLNYFQAFR